MGVCGQIVVTSMGNGALLAISNSDSSIGGAWWLWMHQILQIVSDVICGARINILGVVQIVIGLETCMVGFTLACGFEKALLGEMILPAAMDTRMWMERRSNLATLRITTTPTLTKASTSTPRTTDGPYGIVASMPATNIRWLDIECRGMSGWGIIFFLTFLRKMGLFGQQETIEFIQCDRWGADKYGSTKMSILFWEPNKCLVNKLTCCKG